MMTTKTNNAINCPLMSEYILYAAVLIRHCVLCFINGLFSQCTPCIRVFLLNPISQETPSNDVRWRHSRSTLMKKLQMLVCGTHMTRWVGLDSSPPATSSPVSGFCASIGWQRDTLAWVACLAPSVCLFVCLSVYPQHN